VAPFGLHVWRLPSAKKADLLTDTLPAGSLLFLTRGPRLFNGVDWWEVQADYVAGRQSTFGWVIATDANHASTFAAVAPACPSTNTPIPTDAIRTLGMLVSLSCFGSREIEMRGRVSCSEAAIDSMVGGPSWLGANWLCDIDSVVGLNGPLAGALLDGNSNPPIGRYAVRGHFDDPEARTCSWIGFGVTVPARLGRPIPAQSSSAGSCSS
jgi:hypothetical protein